MQPIKVFISSTQRDLQKERNTVEKVIYELQEFQPVRAETHPRRGVSPRDTIMHMVGECRIYVGIIGERYGTIPDGETRSVTEIEFNAALGSQKHILLYLKKAKRREPKQQQFVNRLFKEFRQGYFRGPEFTDCNGLAKQVKQDLLDFLRECPHETQIPEIVGMPRIAVVEDIPEHLDRLVNGLKNRIQQADVRPFDNASAVVEYVKEKWPHVVVFDSRIPWLAHSHGGTQAIAADDNSARAARLIQKAVHGERYCGGIYLCGYSAFHDCASLSFRDLVSPPLLEKGQLDTLLNDLEERHLKRFLARAKLRLDWIDELTQEFAQTYGRMTPRTPRGPRDFIARIKPDFDKPILRDYLFDRWRQLPDDEPCDIPTLRLWEFRNRVLEMPSNL